MNIPHNTAVQFLPKKITPLQIKLKQKMIKSFEKTQRIRTNHLSKEEEKRALFLVTVSQHYIEALVDCTDELVNMKLIGANHLITQARDEFLKLQDHFLNETLAKGNEVFMRRMAQQKRIEKLFESLHKLDIDQLDALLNFSENIKFKK